MDNLLELRQAVQSDLTVGDESTLDSPTTIDLAINRAYRKAGALFPWSELMDAKKTTTVAGQEYYDYPQTWRSNSVWRLEVAGVRYGLEPDGSPVTFDDYKNWREDYPSSQDKMWGNQERRYFFSPIPTANDVEICIHGVMVTSKLDSDGSVTIFSYSMPEGNEAIVLEAVAILKNKADNDKGGEFRSNEAKQILSIAWSKIAKEKAKYEKNQPFFEVPNFFGNTSSQDLRGRFN